MIGIDLLAGLLFLIVAVLSVALPIGAIWLVVKLVAGLFWVIGRIFGGLFWVVRSGGGRIFNFGRGMVVDSLGAVGALLTAVFFVPFVVGSTALGRWSKVNHYGRALEGELTSFVLCLYRIGLGHPIRLLGLTVLTDGIEKRLPNAVASSPGPEVRDRRGKPSFPGYKVVGSLPTGGSGAHLYLAEPLPEIHDRIASKGHPCPGRVVIKAFSLVSGSTLPQIVRESRALGAARELGLVLDYELGEERFYYVMPYVPGDDLGQVTRRLHDLSGPEGLSEDRMRTAMGLVGDLLDTLDRFHTAGLWHKDIKPSNVIVCEDRAYLVDLGLVTPLRSAMTLTTHGTEYFRDPEMVRLAMQGVKVHEVDGVKFDLYSTGALMYSLLENSFPAHGSLSQMSKRCPEALRWIVRRAMADLKGRYSSVREMQADLRAVAAAADPYAVQPAQLPSMSGAYDPADPSLAASARAASYPTSFPDEPIKKERSSIFASIPWPSWKASKALAKDATAKAKQAGAAARSAGAAARQASAAAAHTASSAVRHASFAAKNVKCAASTAAKSVRKHTRVGFYSTLALVLFSMMAIVPLTILFREQGGRWNGHIPAHAQQVVERLHSRSGALASRIRDILPVRSVRAGRDAEECRNPKRNCPIHSNEQGEFNILVLNDLPPEADPQLLEDLQELLSSEGFDIWGLSPMASAPEVEILMMAGARKAAGLSDPNDTQAISRLHDYVESRSDLDAVLWLASGQRAGSTIYRIVAPEQYLGGLNAVAFQYGPKGKVEVIQRLQ